MQKHIIFLILIILSGTELYSQAVGINQDGSVPNAKSILDVKSTTKGLLGPRMTSAQRIAIAPTVTEEGLIVFDTDLNKYMLWTGTLWETVGDGLWLSHTLGAYRMGRAGVNAIPESRTNLYVYGGPGIIGPDTSTMYVFRYGINDQDEGGTNWSITGVDAGIKAFSYWGNSFSGAVSAYSFLDFNNSTALVAGNNSGTTLALLAHKDNTARIWAGHFTGDVRVSGQMGVGITPNSAMNFHSETSTYDRAGYFFYTKVSTGTTYGIYSGAFGTGSGSKRAAAFECLNGTGTNIAVRAYASGGAVNWSGYFAEGNVYMNDILSIGTEDYATGYLLSVNGKIISEELRIQDMTDWPDYVFAKDYPLMSLYELEKSIEAEKHLPGIPSAVEIEADGILVGDMQKLMMKKIEELTLYTIAQQKQIDQQNLEIEELRKLILSSDEKK